MSTRALITIKDYPLAIYKHSDGYPELPHGVLSWLPGIVEAFVKARPDDPAYLLAQIVRQRAITDAEYDLGRAKGFLGWGVVRADSEMGQEFTYVIDSKTGKMEVLS